MFNAKLLTILLTCAANLEYLSFAMARSSSISMHRLIKRSLNEEGCGVREDDTENSEQIMKGKDSSKKWPWNVSIGYNGQPHYCGGALIDKKHVITAAHCIGEYTDPEGYHLAIGHMEQEEGEYKLKKLIVHEDYMSDPDSDDIALLVLESEVPEDVVPICVPEEDEIGDTETLTIIGFGRTAADESLSETLQEVDRMPYLNPEECDKILLDMNSKALTPRHLCTGDDEGGRGSCMGDSGTPVMHQQPDKSWSLVGVVSWGFGCSENPGIPTIHTRVHAYRDWIQKHIEEEEGE